MSEKISVGRTGLQLIAIFAMLCDHIACVLVDRSAYGALYQGMRVVGRISFPLFAFLLSEGFLHTGNLKRYLARVFLFACISEIPFDLAFHGTFFYAGSQNVLFTFCAALLVLAGVRRFWENLLVQAGIVIAGCLVCTFLQTDYGAFGIVAIVLFYYLRTWQKGVWVMVFYLLAASEGIECYAVLAVPFLAVYRGEKVTAKLPAYFCYIFYPLHLFVLYGIRCLLA